MKFEDLKKVNKEIKTVDVKGKQYAQVNDRILAFREIVPNGSIETEILKNENGVAYMRATIKDENGKVLGVGHAYEREDLGFINKTSYIENCETSAVGRALGMLGIGIDNSIASAEEVDNAIKNQDLLKMKISGNRLQDIKDLIEETKTDESKLLKYYGLKRLEDITLENVSKIEDDLFTKKERQEKEGN